jgi:DNA-binding NarL/FixJ family response regulator
MKSTDSRTWIDLRDSQALRRAAFHSLIEPWANENHIEISSGCLLSATVPEDVEAPALLVLILGSARIDDPVIQLQLSKARALWPDVPVAMVSDHEDRGEVMAAFRAGVRGYVPSTLEPELALQALNFVLGGGTFFPPQVLDRSNRESAQVGARQNGAVHTLTPRQLDVLSLLREGKSNKLIARELSMCESTVKVHVRQIMRKLGAANRTQAALNGIGALDLSPSAEPEKVAASDDRDVGGRQSVYQFVPQSRARS